MANTTAIAKRREQIARRALAGRTRRRTRSRSPASRSASAPRSRRRPPAPPESKGIPSSNSRCVFSIVTVLSSTRMPTASARPPSVMVLMVCPSADSTAMEVRIDSGIDTMTTAWSAMSRGRSGSSEPSARRRSRPRAARCDRVLHEHRLVEQHIDLHAGGAAFWISGNAAFTRLTTSRVEASPFLMMVNSTERLPSARTMFCCTAQPSRTCATSER